MALGTLGVSQYASSQSQPIKFEPGTAIDPGTALTNPTSPEFILRNPSPGYTTWYNNTDRYIDVRTYNQNDTVRWVAYESRRINPKQVVQLYAKGDRFIRILVVQNGATYDSEKGRSFVWNGQNISPAN